MSVAETLSLNLLSPVVLAFALGAIATLVRSDLKFPEALSSTLSIYLLLAIGLKGGRELSHTPLAQVWAPALVTVTLGVLTALLAFAVLRLLGRFDRVNAAAIAAHYGSVSVVTFSACMAFLDALGVAYEPFMATLVVLLEIPGIVVAIALARGGGTGGSWGAVLHETLAGRSIVLLLGGLFIGALGGERGWTRIEPLFGALFQGAVLLLLLELGALAARRLPDLRKAGAFLVGFGMVMPVVNGALGVALGTLAGLSTGGSAVLGVLTASASYIAAPAAVRLALPEANPTFYLTASLGITFPFNLTVGIPLYLGIARLLHRG